MNGCTLVSKLIPSAVVETAAAADPAALGCMPAAPVISAGVAAEPALTGRPSVLVVAPTPAADETAPAPLTLPIAALAELLVVLQPQTDTKNRTY
jgi:hypothetical protein